jgi:hypothetical protein
MNRLVFSAGIIIVFAFALTRIFDNQPPAEIAVIPKKPTTDQPIPRGRLQPNIESPFSSGAPPAIDHEAVIADRIERMKKLHLPMPDRYNKLSIKQLDILANRSDGFAALQLGERYWSEKDSAEWDPDYNISASNKVIAQQYFERAIRGGALIASDVISVKAAEEGDVVEAQAWRIVSSLLDKLTPYEHTLSVNIRPLSPAEEQAAAERAKKIWAELGLQK